jgi:hypothetical protein
MADDVPDVMPEEASSVPASWPDSLAQRAGDGPPADAEQAQDNAPPADYAPFVLPDGVAIDEATLGEARELFAGAKLPQDTAQAFVDFYAGKIRAVAEEPHRVWEETQQQWVREISRDQEIGGSRLKATIEAAGKAIDRFGSPGLREVLNFTGAGNHPEVVRFFARIGRAISEDQPVPAARARVARSAAEMLFPTMQKEE